MAINSRRILKIYKSLDKDQIQLVITKKIEGKHDLDHWLEKLHKLAVMDQLGDDARIKSGDLSIVFGIFTAFTIILTISKPFLFFFPLGFFLLFFYFLMMYILLNKIDIGNHLRIFIVPLLEYFRENRPVNGMIDLKMDFSDPKKDKNLAGELGDKAQSDKIFRHPWMEGKVILENRISIHWNITDIVKETGKYLRGSGEPGKEKKKIKIIHKLDMKFQIPKDQFTLKDQDLKTVETGDYRVIQINKEGFSESLQEGMSPDIFLEAVNTAYSQIVKREEFSP